MANTTNTHEGSTAPLSQDNAELWSDGESEEIISTPKMCAYDPLTRL